MFSVATSVSRTATIVAAVFLLTFVVQISFWFGPFFYPDATYWAEAARDFASGILPSFDTYVAAHPATSILLPSAALIQTGVAPLYAVPIVQVVWISTIVAFIVYQIRQLRPRSLWWLGAAALLIPNVQYLDMTLPSSLAALLSCVFVLALLRMQEKSFTRPACIWLGILMGILLATRIDAGAESLLVSIPYLWVYARSRLSFVFITAILVFCALDPFLLAGIEPNVSSFFQQISIHTAEGSGFGYEFTLPLFAITAILLAMAFIWMRPYTSSLPRTFVLWLTASSVLLSAILLLSPFHPLRYFFPLVLIWETFLPLMVFEALALMRAPFFVNNLIKIEYLIIALFLVERALTILLSIRVAL